MSRIGLPNPLSSDRAKPGLQFDSSKACPQAANELANAANQTNQARRL